MQDLEKLQRQSEILSGKFAEVEEQLTATMTDLKLISPGNELDSNWNSLSGPKVQKYSAGVVILHEADLEGARSLYEIRLGVQLAKIDQSFYGEAKKAHYRIAIPGGAMRSNEENALIDEGGVPTEDIQKSFYYVAEKQLLEDGALHMTYDLSQLAGGVIVSEAIRRVAIEMGEAAESRLEVVELIEGANKSTVLPNMQLPHEDKVKIIAEKLASQGVEYTPPVSLKKVYQRVTEGVVVAKTSLTPFSMDAEETDHQKGVRIVTMAELLRVAQSSASETGYTNYRGLYPNDRHDGLRNPSAAWFMRQVSAWLGKWFARQDTYVDGGSRTNPFA